ncbi:MAG: ribonuclease R [Bacteroidia bacterium]|nr:MAG: ribonuclease R [Bacteroidia bacterium]
MLKKILGKKNKKDVTKDNHNNANIKKPTQGESSRGESSKWEHSKGEEYYTGIFYRRPKDDCDFVEIIDSELKIIIRHENNNYAMDEDTVKIASWTTNSGLLMGKVVEILTHHTQNIVGFIKLKKNKILLDPRGYELDVPIYVLGDNNQPSKTELFNTVIVNYPSEEAPFFEVRILNSLGSIDDDQTFIAQLIIDQNLPVEFSQSALKHVNTFSDAIVDPEDHLRDDLRNFNFVTIDGSDAKDFDDAVFCNFDANQEIFQLYVAIADVAHYVTHDSPLDHDAYLRGTSVYFPKQVIPMLPTRLSNDLCSLNPDKDRLVIYAKISFNQTGEIIDYKINNGIIRSKARLTYEQVQTWIDDPKATPPHLNMAIANLYAAYQILLIGRKKRGAIDFASHEPYFIFDENGKVINIKPYHRLTAHKLIEECMLAANVCVANFLIANNHEGLFRIHEKPSLEKFEHLKAYLKSLAIPFDVAYEDLKPSDYATLLDKVQNHPQFPAISQTALRSMQLANYSPNNIGHFGLSYDNYLHFTSPIRRYPDLLTHRVIKSILKHQHYKFLYPITLMGEHASFTERRSEDLERKINSFYKCEFAKHHIGKNFIGDITGLASFGIFVYIPELMVDGLVHVTALGGDYFYFDEKKQLLFGSKTGIKYQCGQLVEVAVANVDMARLFIDFTLVPKNKLAKN